MNKRLHYFISILTTILFFSCTQKQNASINLLPSWNNGNAKQSIVDFVNDVTKEGEFVTEGWVAGKPHETSIVWGCVTM